MKEIGVIASRSALIMKGERKRIIGRENAYLLIGGIGDEHLRQINSFIESEPNISNIFVKEFTDFVGEKPEELHILQDPEDNSALISSLYFPRWSIDNVVPSSGLIYALPTKARILGDKKILCNEGKVKKTYQIPLDSIDFKNLENLETKPKIEKFEFNPNEYKNLKCEGTGEMYSADFMEQIFFTAYDNNGRKIALRLMMDKTVLEKFDSEKMDSLTKKRIREILKYTKQTEASITSSILNQHKIKSSIYINGKIAFPFPPNFFAYDPEDSIINLEMGNENKRLELPRNLVSSLNYLQSDNAWFKEAKKSPVYIG
jgi:hypothetical protein